MSAAEFWEGKDAVAPKFSLEATYEGEAPVEVPTDYKPTPAPAPTPKAEPKPEPKVEPTPAPAARSPPPSVNDNKASMANMAAKFADKDEQEESADEASSFEEIPKPVERPSATAVRQEEKTRGPEISKSPEPAAINERAAKAAEPEPESVKETPRSVSTSSTAASHAAAGIKDYLSDIKSMLENQNTQLANQLEQITHLTAEVNLLKTKVADINSGEKDEKIRQLELELEEARS